MGTPGCLMLLMGIPGSGKTALAKSISRHLQTEHHQKWISITIHFDDFHPTDLRCVYDGVKEKEQFVLKDVRLRVKNSLEHFIAKNHLGTRVHSRNSDNIDMCCQMDSEDLGQSLLSTSDGQTSESPLEWETFVKSISKHSSSLRVNDTLDKDGRINGHSNLATLLILDDNMYLKSMRYEYYQLAKKFGLGFAQAVVRCSSEVAKTRNAQRSIPIPNSTIDLMEQSIEYPQPQHNPWEERSIVISSECSMEQFIHSGCERIQALIEGARANPVPPVVVIDAALKESSQAGNLKSYVHQADIILRKCISRQFEVHSAGDSCSKYEKGQLARSTNAVRRTLLEEIRTGTLSGMKLDTHLVGHAFSDQYKELVDTTFSTMLANAK